MSTCVPADQLGALARGELSPEDAARIQAHVDGCPSCYAQLLRGEERDTGEVATGALHSPPRWAEPEGVELDWQPGRDLGRYVILLTLGKGGMGVVFRAYDKELDRAVALKVLRQEEGEDSTLGGGHLRLLREAQAMARLSHPNVVTVHDVVVLEKRVCMVMELVEGVSAREWLKQEPRPGWREVLRVYRAAGEGLAAAHEAKLVHRDFKPDNVLVGQDGRIRVTDFGIARLAGAEPLAPAAGEGSPPAPAPLAEGSAPSTPASAGIAAAVSAAAFHTTGTGNTTGNTTGGATPNASTPTQYLTQFGGGTLAKPITQEGQVVGTPRYMAPEQFANRPADFRTDQYSFAIALYEALYGQLPFAGNTVPARLEHAKRDEVLPPPSSSHVPPWIHRIVARALSADPAQRFESMQALTHALGRDPSQRRNRALVAAGVVGALILASVALVRSSRSRAELCTGSERKLAGIWDPARRAQIQAAFAATKLPFAADSFELAAKVLDQYTSEWVQTHREACEATSVRGEQSEQVLTLRMACLQQRLEAVSTITELFTRADPGLVAKSKQALDELPRLDTCSDVARLTAKLPLPEDPKAAAEVERLRKDVTRVRMLLEAGKVKDAEKLATPDYADAQQTGYLPVISETEVNYGAVVAANGKYEDAEKLYQSAFSRALAAGDSDMLTRSAIKVGEISFRLHQDQHALLWLGYGEAANQRTKDPEVSVMAANGRGNVARNAGDFVTAARYYQQAEEAAKATLGPDHMDVLGTSYNHASALQNLGRFREASVEYEQVIAAARRTLGPKHPFLAFPLVGSGLVALYRNQLDLAKTHFSEVLALTNGKGLNADNAYEALSQVAVAEGRYQDAVDLLQHAYDIDNGLNKGGVEALALRAEQALVMIELGKQDQAWPIFEEVLAKVAKLPDSFDAVSYAQEGEATILIARNEAAKALPLAEAAVKTLIPVRGKAHPQTLRARLVVADAHWALGKRAEAVQDAQDVVADAKAELSDTDPLVLQAKALIARADAHPR